MAPRGEMARERRRPRGRSTHHSSSPMRTTAHGLSATSVSCTCVCVCVCAWVWLSATSVSCTGVRACAHTQRACARTHRGPACVSMSLPCSAYTQQKREGQGGRRSTIRFGPRRKDGGGANPDCLPDIMCRDRVLSKDHRVVGAGRRARRCCCLWLGLQTLPVGVELVRFGCRSL